MLEVVGGREAVGELSYLAQTDAEGGVRAAARSALGSFGETEIYDQLRLSSHGFQGLLVSPPLKQ